MQPYLSVVVYGGRQKRRAILMDIVMSVTLYSVVIFLLSSILGNSRALAFGFTKTHALVHAVDQAGKKMSHYQ